LKLLQSTFSETRARLSSRSSVAGSPAKKEEQAKVKVAPTTKTKDPRKKKAGPKKKQKEEPPQKEGRAGPCYY
jgi:hypothetical protein